MTERYVFLILVVSTIWLGARTAMDLVGDKTETGAVSAIICFLSAIALCSMYVAS